MKTVNSFEELHKELQKETVWRSEKYKKYIRSLTCVASGAPAEVAHHITGTKNRGTSTKPHDYYCIPLTAYQHAALHTDIDGWEELFGTQVEHWERIKNQAIEDGQLTTFILWKDGLECMQE